MKSSAAADVQVDEERPDSNVQDVVPAEDDKHSGQVDQNTIQPTEDGSELTDLSEEKIPEEPLSDHERHLLFEKGIKFKKKGNLQHGLYCLLACVRGLKDGSEFQQLPECLHNIAEIYSQLGDYENAVSFAQAEKLYYETSLISVGNELQSTQNEPDNTGSFTTSDKSTGDKVSQPEVKDDPQGQSTEARSANEYEKLAHMCLKQKDAQLALEYCGKAVKLRQSIYGEEHPITKRTLDLFTVIYAEMGKEQYTAAMQKFNKSKQSDEASPEKATQSPESTESAKETSAESAKGNVKENGDTAVDSRPTPAGESHEEEHDTTAPDAQVNSTCWSLATLGQPRPQALSQGKEERAWNRG
ncbi:consortin-like isoform X2 [Orbicella faveolata]|uniref:consortin-like isoform X1 n=1 Tax=Orbicella faveolata TaxID=48498 RepID=UPI0009E35248|nr:consortin-like isoform X1 [Orbicella faveolata]XP_020608105.1 consortin-like isoform X2 [Orbicella faveolata]